jgi:uncharacterized protein YijF (DUF1287 family)
MPILRKTLIAVALLTFIGAPSAFAQADVTARIIDAARQQTQSPVTYDGSYRKIAYPMGDVPQHVGVCTDVIVRAYRTVGTDLQQLVHEDMRLNFDMYPKRWGLRQPDSNIDHRRVPNLQVYFRRFGKALPFTTDASTYRPGDLVTWTLPGGLPHIGIVSDRKVEGTSRPLIIHNIGAGPVEDDILFQYTLTGRYRFPRDVEGQGSKRRP